MPHFKNQIQFCRSGYGKGGVGVEASSKEELTQSDTEAFDKLRLTQSYTEESGVSEIDEANPF